MTIICINCTGQKAIDGSKLCQSCYDIQNEQLKSKLLDIETYDEDRLVFLVRTSQKLGLKHTKKDIKKMIVNGMSDDLILRTKPLSIWTRVNEISQISPVKESQ